ncbi:MAG: hypothetical protein WCI60_03560 [bacterium]
MPINIKSKLAGLNLLTDNSIVIGSGIMNALNIRPSNDIDVVVSSSTYENLRTSGKFNVETKHGRQILTDSIFEIGTSWSVLGKDYNLTDLLKESVIINDVHYITLDFLLSVKESWLQDENVRQKDLEDVQLIKEHKTR